NETQVIATVFSYDKDNETDVLALCGASAALWISPAPMSEPVAGVRIVKTGGQWFINPTKAQALDADVSLVIAGTANAITMVEGGAKEAPEADFLDALDMAQVEIKKICAVIEELRAAAGKERMAWVAGRTAD